ncbi:hypothetical protein BvCmsHHP056_03697 [Escherichia coli]|uniref:hypothetical protein n=1 Tax=Escherichia coli TaxID=562 RepID=UPI0010E78884|nr:hypothetical protein [Escherichia coli]GCS56223.1 hypothetical protein BvCmsHHP056_03697 [Escherichia coli]
MVIYFFPFKMEENDVFLESEVKHQNMKNKQCFGVRASDKTPLCFLKPGDVLYIFAHGNTSVIGTGSASGPTLSLGTLATQLIHRRLPKSFKDIRILSCNSGIHSKTPAFALRLKEIMYRYGYHDLVVTGYLGEVDVSRDWRLKNHNEDMDFYSSKKKGIIPISSILTESQKAFCGSDLKFSLSDFKVRY